MCTECDNEGDDYENSLKDCDDRIELETCEVNSASSLFSGQLQEQ